MKESKEFVQKDYLFEKEITLPSGKKAQFIQAKGKHLREAQKLAGKDGSFLVFALASQIVRIDGAQYVMEDFDDMDLADVGAITAEVGEYLSPVQKT